MFLSQSRTESNLPWQTRSEAWRTQSKEYYQHHFGCPSCMAAGRGQNYGSRCEIGLKLWQSYQVNESQESQKDN